MTLVQKAAFLVRGDRVHSTAAPGGTERLRCASLLKPLLFWAGAGVDAGVFSDQDGWAAAASAAVVRSANDPAVGLWDACGGDRLLALLAERTRRSWTVEPGGGRGFGRVLITATDAAAGYAALALAARDGGIAPQLLEWMRSVPERQTFGARRAAAEQLGVPAAAVAVKCGWFCAADETRLRTHAVTVTDTPGGDTRGSVVLTAIDAPAALRTAYARAYVDGDEVLDHHWEIAAGTVATATRDALRLIP